MNNICLHIMAACIALCGAAVQAQEHGHLNAGAKSQSAGSQLTFDNGADFAGNYVKTLTFADAGKFANLFEGNITFTALHHLDPFGDPMPGAPAAGAFIIAEIVSVEGPTGGAFQFWETNSTTSAAFDIPVGTTNGNFRFDLSEARLGAGDPGGDPFGHIHGRRFSVTKPGLYTIGFRAYDLSTNGPGGGPIHTPSEGLDIHFQGGVNITKLERGTEGSSVTFGAMSGYDWQLQSRENLGETAWTPVGPVIPGNDTLVEVLDEGAPTAKFYRVLGVPVAP